MGIWLALSGKIKVWIAVIGAFCAALGLAYLKGRKDEDYDREIQDFNEYVETRKRMDDAGPSDDDIVEWLSARSKQ